jgi:hypothetical protein
MGNYEIMSNLTDEAPWLIHTAFSEPDDGIRKGIGWGAAALLIVGSSLALASLAWFLIGLFTWSVVEPARLVGAPIPWPSAGTGGGAVPVASRPTGISVHEVDILLVARVQRSTKCRL